MERKAPRRTRERILNNALNLFNEFGEPNVTTTVISDEMNISPGNLYYHFRNKDDIINSIFTQFEDEMGSMLAVPADRKINVEDGWLFLNHVFEIIWRYRFLYRDLNDLLSRNRTLEVHFKQIINHTIKLVTTLCQALVESGEMKASQREIDTVAMNVVIVATYWLSYEYVRDPRHFNDQKTMSNALSRGAYQVMSLLAPFLIGDARDLFEKLAGAFLQKSEYFG
jgi:AcrR family transcriptional regulator